MSIERVSNVIGHKDKKMTALYAGEDPEKVTRASQDMQVIANELNRIAYKTAAN